MNEGTDRSVSAGGNIIGSVLQTGDNNNATLNAVQLPPADTVDIASAIAGLRVVLLALQVPDRGKLDRALEDAREEADKPVPDRGEIAGSVTRALGYAKQAAEFSQHAGTIRDALVQIAGWLGAASPYIGALLASGS